MPILITLHWSAKKLIALLEKTHERVAPAQIIVNPDDQAAQATQAIQAVQAAQHIQGPCTTGLEIVTINNVGAIREEIEIELLSCEGASFTGSLTMQEAKHGIYRDCLGFKDFKNKKYAYNKSDCIHW